MKVLMIDDEPLARIGIRSIIPWDEKGFTLVGEAKNGVEGLELAKRYHPDIILVDIVMPEMGGIEFIRQVKPLLPDSKIIIMSCMNEIQYYQEAIRFGVSEYILKDKINPEEILETVNRVADELRRNRVFDENDVGFRTINENVVLAKFMNLVLQGRIRDGKKIAGKLKQRGIKTEEKKFLVACISVHYENFQEEDNSGGFLDYSIINLIQEIVSSRCGGYIFKSYDGNIAAILINPESTDVKLFIGQLFNQMKETVEQCMDCSITMGISKTFTNLEAICEGYKQACSAVEISFFKGRGRLYNYLYDHHLDNLVSVKAEKILCEILKVASITEIKQISDELADMTKSLSCGGVTIAKARSLYLDILYHIIFLLRQEKLELSDILKEDIDAYSFFGCLESIEEYHCRLEELIIEIDSYCRNNITAKNNRLILEIHRYIESHLHEKFKLEDIAGEVYLSPSYLCRLYKRETGENLHNYILKRKVNKAKELLSVNNVGTVAGLLGFNSHSYFIRIFREHTGCTPLQYQKKFLNSEEV